LNPFTILKVRRLKVGAGANHELCHHADDVIILKVRRLKSYLKYS
jgi:hypothetical protein